MRLRCRVALCRVLGIAFVAIGAAACGDAPRADSGAESAIDRIVFVTIDTLRADHLASYGYPRVTSPFLDGLADRGVLFENAFTAIPTTAPSHASIFTSLYPFQHGLRRNGLVLGDEFVTLAEEMQGWGFRTGGFVATRVHFGPANLAQGFEAFAEPPASERAEDRSLRVVERAIAWLDGLGHEERFFLWVHLFDPHTPLAPPPELLEHFAGAPPAEREALARFLRNEHAIDPAFHRAEGRDLLALMDAYDAEILAADRALARLSEGIRRAGLSERLLWVVTSDHGEGLGSHGEMGHGSHLYNEQLRVPLVVAYASGQNAGRRVAAVIETVDLLPTFADLVGRPLSSSPLPRQGRSFVAWLEGGAPETSPARVAFSERRVYAPLPSGSSRARRAPREPGEKRAVQDGAFKLIARTEGSDELYDVAVDPSESLDLVSERTDVADRLRAALDARLAAPRGAEGELPTVDEETQRGLEALGYVQ